MDARGKEILRKSHQIQSVDRGGAARPRRRKFARRAVLALRPAGAYGTSADVRCDGLLHPERPTPAEPDWLGMADRVCGKPRLAGGAKVEFPHKVVVALCCA